MAPVCSRMALSASASNSLLPGKSFIVNYISFWISEKACVLVEPLIFQRDYGWERRNWDDGLGSFEGCFGVRWVRAEFGGNKGILLDF